MEWRSLSLEDSEYTPFLTASASVDIAIELGSFHRVLVLCCGCGAEVLALAHEGVAKSVYGSDLDPKAIVTSWLNLKRNPHEAVRGFWVRDGLEGAEGHFDLIIAGPPLTSDDCVPSELEGRPSMSLDGGSDGLKVHRKIVPVVASVLEPEGRFIVTVAHGQYRPVRALAEAHDLQFIRFQRCRVHGVPRHLIFGRANEV